MAQHSYFIAAFRMCLVQVVQLWTIEQIVQLPVDKLVFVQLAIWATHFW